MTFHYDSPLGGITIDACNGSITGLWFDGQKWFGGSPYGLSRYDQSPCQPGDLAVFDETRRWLDIYFSGRAPAFTPALRMTGSPFRRRVWQALLRIPYGHATTYKAIADEMARERPSRVMAPRAVGGAVGHNPIALIIPCHRVIGSDGSLTGYAGGVERKRALLRLEGFLKEK